MTTIFNSHGRGKDCLRTDNEDDNQTEGEDISHDMRNEFYPATRDHEAYCNDEPNEVAISSLSQIECIDGSLRQCFKTFANVDAEISYPSDFRAPRSASARTSQVPTCKRRL